MLYVSGKIISNLDSCFKKKVSWKKVFSIHCSMLSVHRNLVHGFTLQMFSMIFFALNCNTNSYGTRIPDNSQNPIFLNDFCGLSSDSDILQVILNSIACTYENHHDFPNCLLKKCSGLFATLLRTVFNSIILDCQLPEIGKPSFIKPIHQDACRKKITNFRPISLQPKISLILEKLIQKILIDILKNKIYQRQYGFQSKRSTIFTAL